MAAKKEERNYGELLVGALIAHSTGFGLGAGMNALDNNVDFYKKNPIMGPATAEMIALATLFLPPKRAHTFSLPAAFGAMGAIGMDISGDVINGLSRMHVDSSMNQDDMDDMESGGYGDSRDPSIPAGDRVVNDGDFEPGANLGDEDEESGDGT